MNHQCGMLNAECGRNAVEPRCATAALSIQHSSFSIRPSRRGLTLIELLVTIVIMVTVLAGVLPMISPNNNARKIRESARQLSSLMAQAQAQAARDGRPHGVAFREFSAGGTNLSGMSLEAFTIAEPQPFAGFSEHSRAVVTETTLVYGPVTSATGIPLPTGKTPNEAEGFSPRYDRLPICEISFVANGGVDFFPPQFLRIGDIVAVAGNEFFICDVGQPDQQFNPVQSYNGVDYLRSDPSVTMAPIPGTVLHAIWLNAKGQSLPGVPTPRTGQMYQIRRQPANTSDAPLQFPRGIGIDLQASGADGLNVPFTFDSPGDTVIGVMFSPNGALESVYQDGKRIDGVEQVFMLMGLFENGNDGSQDGADYDFTDAANITDDDLAQRRTRINWLSADCRWVSANRAGRVITSENNTSFDPRQPPFSDAVTGTDRQMREARLKLQLNGRGAIDGARKYAREMTGSSGR